MKNPKTINFDEKEITLLQDCINNIPFIRYDRSVQQSIQQKLKNQL